MIEYAYIQEGSLTAPVLADSFADIKPLYIAKKVKGIGPVSKEVEAKDDEGNYYLETIFEDGEVEVTVYEEATNYKVRVLDYDTGQFSVHDGLEFNKGEQDSVEDQVHSLTHVAPIEIEGVTS